MFALRGETIVNYRSSEHSKIVRVRVNQYFHISQDGGSPQW